MQGERGGLVWAWTPTLVNQTVGGVVLRFGQQVAVWLHEGHMKPTRHGLASGWCCQAERPEESIITEGAGGKWASL